MPLQTKQIEQHQYIYFVIVENVEQKTILPSPFIGSRRDLTQPYEDSMAIVLNDGKPHIFLTMTCNPSWSDISTQLATHQTPQLHDVVLKYMVHGTCRTLNPKSPSMKNSQCKKNYPKQFLEEICQGNDSHWSIEDDLTNQYL